MKKLLMLGAILVLGATAFAADANIDEKKNQAEANVTVKARLVAENLVISDLEGKQIVLDFGKVSKTRKSGTSEAETGYMVRYVGDDLKGLVTGGKGNANLAMYLLNKETGDFDQKAVPVTMTATTQQKGQVADTFEVQVGLNTYAGVMPLEREKGHDYSEYTGVIFGTLDHDKTVSKPVNGTEGGTVETGVELAALDSGDYLGSTVLQVTINNGEDFK